MKKWSFFLLLLLCVTGYAEEADVTPIYKFAGEHDAGIIAEITYEAALDGDAGAWEAVCEWFTERLLHPAAQVADAALKSVVPVLILALVRGCLPEANGAGMGARFLLRMLLLLGFSDLAELSLSSAAECIASVKKFTDAAAPGIAALLATMGMKGTAALASPAATLAGGIAEGVFLKYGLPLCRIALCGAIAGNLSETIDLNRFTNLLKKITDWGAGLVTTLFTALITLQGNVSEAADSIGMRTAKFAADSAAPVIGSGVTEAWDGFVSGMMITKNAMGMSGMVAILAAGFQPMVCCLTAMLLLSLIASLLELFGEKETAKAAEQIGGICRMALSLATGSLVIVIVLLGTMMSVGRCFYA